MARASDIPIEPPTVSGPGIVRAVEDRSYIGFIAAAMVSALLGGFLFAAWVPLATTGTLPGSDRVPWMTQAHGWLQLQGWAGMFVAGMAIRLIPRFAGRKPIPRTITIPILAVLAIPLILRIALQPWAEDDLANAVAVAIGVGTATGTTCVAAVLAFTLAKGRNVREPWRYFAWAGTVWWAAWAVLALTNIPRGDVPPGLIPYRDNDAFLWVVMLGPIGNFIWGVQSRSVPVFYGRGTPSLRKVGIPGVMFNAGVAAVALSLSFEADAAARTVGVGFMLLGPAMAWLAPIAGSIWGTPIRLRPKARPAARFVIAANIAAMAAGLLLVYAGTRMAFDPGHAAFGTRDAARHVFGVGTITMLILGMARLVAPFFALERTESGVPRALERLPFWLLLAAVVLRAAVPLLGDTLDYDLGRHALATAGLLAWLAIAIFAFSVARALRAEPRTRRELEELAAKARIRNTGAR